MLPDRGSLACHAATRCRKRLTSHAGESGKTATQQRRNFSKADLNRRGAFAKREASASNVRMNSGRAKRARRERDAAQRYVTGRIEKLNWLLRAALSSRDLRRSLGEDAEINFPLVIKLLLMVLKGSCETMYSLQTRRAEGCECNDAESAHDCSDCPVRLDNFVHIHFIRFNVFGRKSLYPAGSRCGRSCCAANSRRR
jgi:hypothetical protein